MKISDNEKSTDFEFVLDDSDRAMSRIAMDERAKLLEHLNAMDSKSMSRLANPVSFGNR